MDLSKGNESELSSAGHVTSDPQSSGELHSPTFSMMSEMLREGPNLGEVLLWHLTLCSECQEYQAKATPRGIGQRSEFCVEYWEIVTEYAEYEGYSVRGEI